MQDEKNSKKLGRILLGICGGIGFGKFSFELTLSYNK